MDDDPSPISERAREIEERVEAVRRQIAERRRHSSELNARLAEMRLIVEEGWSRLQEHPEISEPTPPAP